MEESSKQGQTKEAKQHRKKQARYIYMHIAHVQTHTQSNIYLNHNITRAHE